SGPSLDEQVAELRSAYDAATSPAVRDAIVLKLGPLEDAQRVRDMNARGTEAINAQRDDKGQREARRRAARAALSPVEQLQHQVAAAASAADTIAKRVEALPVDGSTVLREVGKILRRIGSAEPPASFRG